MFSLPKSMIVLDLRMNRDLRKIVAKTDFLVHKLFDFLRPNVWFKKENFPKMLKNIGTFFDNLRAISEKKSNFQKNIFPYFRN